MKPLNAIKTLFNKVENELTDEGVAFIKEHEDHIRCYEALIEEMSRREMHGRNIFGGK